MRRSQLIAGILASCLVSLEVMEAPLALADVLASRTAYHAERFATSSTEINTTTEAVIPEVARVSVSKTTPRTQFQYTYKKKSRRRSKSASKSRYARTSSVRSPSGKSKKRSYTQYPARNSRKSSYRSTASRYRSAKSSKKYSRYHGKRRHSSRHSYSRRHRYRHSRSSSGEQYARVSDAVRSVKSGLAQNWHETLTDVEMMPGVRYKHYLISTGNKHSVHVLEVDRTKPEVGITLFKGQNVYNGLERLSDIAARVDSANGMLQGLINGSFWKSASNVPLGPTVINGEVLEMGQYKEWSACFFDRQNRMYIERFSISGMVKLKSITLDIEKVNRRTSKDGVVLYNHLAGKSVPVAPPLQVEMVEGDRQTSPDELSDTKVSKAEFNRIVVEQQRSAEFEKNLRKAVLLYSGQPAVNEEVACRVIEVDSGMVNVPQNGLVLSFGDNIEADDIPKPGDKVMVHFKTNLFSSVPFVQALAGTPRLVNRGIAKHEAEFEGVQRGERFLSQKMPRTAVGMDATGTMLYFVAVEGTSSENNTSGMTMQQLAEGMKQLGAYHAMSLDGGSSSAMVVRGGGLNENIGNQRKISLALGIVKQSANDRPIMPRRKLITKPASGSTPSKPDNKDGNQTAPSEQTVPEKSNGTPSVLANDGPNGKD